MNEIATLTQIDRICSAHGRGEMDAETAMEQISVVIIEYTDPKPVKRTMKIIARKPKDTEGNEYIVVERDNGEYVSATANAHSLAYGEWFWGHYFPTEGLAMKHFNARESK